MIPVLLIYSILFKNAMGHCHSNLIFKNPQSTHWDVTFLGHWAKKISVIKCPGRFQDETLFFDSYDFPSQIDRNISPAFALQHIKVEQQDITIMEYNSWGRNPRCFVTWTNYIYIYRLIYKRNTIWLIWQASPNKERSTKSVEVYW